MADKERKHPNERECPKCGRKSYSANWLEPMPCAYEDCDGILPPPKEGEKADG
jgi:hypothetical protein